MNLNIARSTVIELCKEAGEKIATDFVSGDISFESKGGMDFLTKADARTDEFLRTELKRKFPKTQFLTEETSDGDFSNFVSEDFVWIIDPIDGTTNFFRGNPHFSISVALVSKGKAVLGVVYLPIENKLYVADQETDQASLNDSPLSVSKTTKLDTSTVAYDWSWDLSQRQKTYEKLSRVISRTRQMLTLGCASADMCLVAEGRLDGYFLYGIKPWDIAAASLILEKAGGNITKIDGSTWDVFEPDFLASNGVLHEKLVHLLA